MNNKFGQRLTELREAAGLTQGELAEIINTSNQTVSAYEKGKADPSTETLGKLAEHFKVSTDFLLNRKPANIPADEIITKDIIQAIKSSTHLDGSPLDDSEREKLQANMPTLIKIVKALIKE